MLHHMPFLYTGLRPVLTICSICKLQCCAVVPAEAERCPREEATPIYPGIDACFAGYLLT